MTDNVRVSIDPPRHCRETEKAWFLELEGEPTISFPKSQTNSLVRDPESGLVVAANVTPWIAKTLGFIGNDDSQEKESNESSKSEITREDLYRAFAMHALLTRGEPPNDKTAFEARDIACKMTRLPKGYDRG